jgi:hypothetical protein
MDKTRFMGSSQYLHGFFFGYGSWIQTLEVLFTEDGLRGFVHA